MFSFFFLQYLRMLLETSVNKTQNRSLKFTPNGLLHSVDLMIKNLDMKYEWNTVL